MTANSDGDDDKDDCDDALLFPPFWLLGPSSRSEEEQGLRMDIDVAAVGRIQ
eukprot:CAMPEP_0203661098 /NCGR_PEP_ID=MMETSP0088-20131115/59225_1 /ASSEMBLY_ACC=CAM_ASM_001087 /TAXON_ID=426623 /ORGANISM="Chaetoceros affinis, Strain CCMP159" /LENGTH=51 /DNA_ID=CAMNT_0050523723 /DNA_START=29 /DNA_END=181 /DNA_ORIENTATION=+